MDAPSQIQTRRSKWRSRRIHAPAPIRVSFLSTLGRFAGLWHLTSLDAPTVAVTWSLGFAWASRIELPFWVPLALGLGTWAIYIADRLLDARSTQLQSPHTPSPKVPQVTILSPGVSDLRPRHHFHWHHRLVFAPLAVASLLTALTTVALFMPVAARGRNAALAAAALLYFSAVHTRKRIPTPQILKLLFQKELLVGVIFTLACATPTYAIVEGKPFQILPALACFIGLAWLNCHAIETWESNPGPTSTNTFRLAVLLATFIALTAALSAVLHQPRPAALLASAALSAALLALLDRHRARLSPLMLRTAADAVLLTPLALLALQ